MLRCELHQLLQDGGRLCPHDPSLKQNTTQSAPVTAYSRGPPHTDVSCLLQTCSTVLCTCHILIIYAFTCYIEQYAVILFVKCCMAQCILGGIQQPSLAHGVFDPQVNALKLFGHMVFFAFGPVHVRNSYDKDSKELDRSSRSCFSLYSHLWQSPPDVINH